jgi:pSer/pThr/pTyr-binding forkhead associated (FHA) protein
MVTNDSTAVAGNRRRPARDLIAAVVENMRHNLETLKYSTLAPSRYIVYLHSAEFARLEGIIPILQDETVRALREELDRLNNPSGLRRYGGRFFRETGPKIQTPTGEWQVEFVADPDGELAEGDILIDSELVLPAQPELGVGERTRRITTHVGERTTTEERTTPVERTSAERTATDLRPGPGGQAEERTVRTREQPVLRPFATIAYEDQSGQHTYDITTEAITIGRGGSTRPVDVKIVSSVDVSREHARIRRDPATSQFFLTDLSTLGTTLNNRHVPRGFDEVDGARRETGVETPLPDRARIGLAETVFLEFTRTDNPAKAGPHEE